MFKSTINKVFISLGLVVVAGSMLLGINTVFAEPTSDPGDSTTVHPTFSGVTIEDGGDSISITSSGITKDSVTGAFQLNANSRVIEIATGVVFRILTELHVKGISSFDGDVNIGTIASPKTLTTTGTTVSTNLAVTGTSLVNIFVATGNTLLSNTTVGTTTSPKDLMVKGNTSLLGTVNIGDVVTPGYLEVYGNTSTNYDLDVGGALTVNGSVDFNGSLGIVVAYGTVTRPTTTVRGISSSVCSTGTIIGCNLYISDANIKGYANYLDPNTNTCYGSGIDAVANSGYIRANALCLK